jgi:membrane complex biogenesis BtpA family protein
MNRVLERAVADAETLVEGGLSGIIVENYGDVPFHPREVPTETVAAMTAAVHAVCRVAPIPVGVNVLRNDGPAAVAVAGACGAAFVRVNVHAGVMVTDQGLLEGRAHETLRLRKTLGTSVSIFADVFVKHATPPPGLTLEEAARDTRERGLADVLVVSGRATGGPTAVEHVKRVRAAAPDAPVWIGSGARPETAAALLQVADGLIVGSALEDGGVAGRAVDPRRVERFMAAVSAG